MIPWKPEVVIIGPGGSLAYYYVGALQALEEHGYLQNVHTYIGVSAGALVSALMVAGYTADQLYNESVSTDLLSLVQVNTIQSFLASWGLISAMPLEQRLTLLFKAKFGTSPTFKELHALTGKSVIIIASDLDDRVPIVFSHTSTPDVSVVEAVVASCTVPLIFSQRTYGGHRVIDGAFTDPYPLHLGARIGNTLGVVMDNTGTDVSAPDPYPIASYTLPIHQLKQNAIDMWKDAPTVYHIGIPTTMNSMSMFSDEQKRTMVTEGYDSIKRHVPS